MKLSKREVSLLIKKSMCLVFSQKLFWNVLSCSNASKICWIDTVGIACTFIVCTIIASQNILNKQQTNKTMLLRSIPSALAKPPPFNWGFCSLSMSWQRTLLALGPLSLGRSQPGNKRSLSPPPNVFWTGTFFPGRGKLSPVPSFCTQHTWNWSWEGIPGVAGSWPVYQLSPLPPARASVMGTWPTQTAASLDCLLCNKPGQLIQTPCQALINPYTVYLSFQFQWICQGIQSQLCYVAPAAKPILPGCVTGGKVLTCFVLWFPHL